MFCKFISYPLSCPGIRLGKISVIDTFETRSMDVHCIICTGKGMNINTCISSKSILSFFIQQDWYDKWSSTDTVKGCFIGDILRHGMRSDRDIRKLPLAVMCDSVAMAVTINPSIITKTRRSHVMVEVKGEVTRGQMVKIEPDRKDHPKDVREVDIMLECDGEAYRNMLSKIVE